MMLFFDFRFNFFNGHRQFIFPERLLQDHSLEHWYSFTCTCGPKCCAALARGDERRTKHVSFIVAVINKSRRQSLRCKPYNNSSLFNESFDVRNQSGVHFVVFATDRVCAGYNDEFL